MIVTLSGVQLRNLLAQIAYDESAWDYGLIGDDNELGRYQIDVQTLENYGLLAAGSVTAYGNDCINYRHCWQSTYNSYENYFYNITNIKGFLTNKTAQEHLAYQLIFDIYNNCVNVGTIKATDDTQTVAGMLNVAWTLGVGTSPSPSDPNGTGAWAWRHNNIGAGTNNYNSGRYAIAILSQ
jgi:hypothetical protein